MRNHLELPSEEEGDALDLIASMNYSDACLIVPPGRLEIPWGDQSGGQSCDQSVISGNARGLRKPGFDCRRGGFVNSLRGVT
jgi:hypothetical protein